MHSADAEKLAQLWTASQSEVAAFVRALVRDATEADDVLQQVAVQLVRNFDRYDPLRPFTAWAIGIAKNEVLAWRRKLATDRHVFSDSIVELVAAGFENSALENSAEDDGPRRQALSECYDEALEDRGREAIDMYYQHGLKSPEIGRRLSISPGAARKLLSRSRELLRKCIDARLAAWRAR